jgi:glutaredoxin
MKKYLLLIPLLFIGTATAEVYKWKDSAGHVHFSDKPPTDAKAEKMKIKTSPPKTANSPSVATTEESTETETAPAPVPKQVVMYATSWCGYCKMARNYFRGKNIPYVEYDIEQNAQAKKTYDSFGGHGVPVIFVNQERLNGFSVARFENLYQ